MDAEKITVSGDEVTGFANKLSDLLHDAIESGLPCDVAVCVAAGVIADYARESYGPAYLQELAKVVAEAPLRRPGATAPGHA